MEHIHTSTQTVVAITSLKQLRIVHLDGI